MADHRIIAATYDHLLALSEARGLAARRHELLSRARGRVLEIGAGTGLNLAHYPPAVTSLVALEPDGARRRRLEARLAAGGSVGAVAGGEAAGPTEVVEADVDGATFPEHSFDTVVSTLVLCTVADPAATVAAIRTWLAPDGRLLFLEPVRAAGLAGRLQQVADPVWRLAAAGFHLDRDILAILREADLAVTDCQRFALPAGGLLLRSCVLGVARPRPLIPEVPLHAPPAPRTVNGPA